MEVQNLNLQLNIKNNTARQIPCENNNTKQKEMSPEAPAVQVKDKLNSTRLHVVNSGDIPWTVVYPDHFYTQDCSEPFPKVQTYELEIFDDQTKENICEQESTQPNLNKSGVTDDLHNCVKQSKQTQQFFKNTSNISHEEDPKSDRKVPEINNLFSSSISNDEKQPNTIQMSNDSHILSVSAIINDIFPTPVLVDTGAAVTAISANLWNKISVVDESVQLSSCGITDIKTVSGTQLPVLGHLTIQFTIQGNSYPFDTFVINGLNYDAILGRDFLQFYQSNIDLHSGTLSLSFPLPFSSEPNLNFNTTPDIDNSSHSVHAMFSFILQPLSEMLVPAKINFVYPMGTIGLISPASQLSIRYNFVGATALVSVSDETTVPVRILNPTTQPITIFRNMKLGQFQKMNPSTTICSFQEPPSTSQQVFSVSPTNADPDIEIDFSNTDLTLRQQEDIRKLLRTYSNVFSHSQTDLGRTSIVQHVIDTGDHKPIKLRPYRTSPENREEISRQVQEMLKNDLVEESCSAWSAPVILVKKKDGSARFVVDYRALNKITSSDVFPLPRIDETLDHLCGTKYFSTLDFRSGFWQIAMSPCSKDKTAFITHDGLYQWKVLPMGLSGSPSCFQRLMTHVLRGLTYKKALVYLDDVIIYSKSFDQHLLDLEEVFQRFQAANIKLKPSKCLFAKKQVEFLGHIVSSDGISPNPNKIAAVKDFPKPQNVKGVRSFLGLANYYRRFVPRFSFIAKPLNNLTRKGVKFHWDANCQEAFDKLKRALTSAPILAYPDFTLQFEVYTDASLDGLGYCLGQIQNGREVVICYGGRDLNTAERNYSATEREALAVVDAIKKFQPYLHGRKFTVHTDHNALKWLMSLKSPEGRLARWALLLQHFDFDIKYRSGRSNGNADALSRRSYGERQINALDVPGVQIDKVKAQQRRDPDLRFIIDYLEHDILPLNDCLARKLLLAGDMFYLDDNGLLFHLAKHGKHKSRDPFSQLVIPNSLKHEILVQAHDEVSAGHVGIHKCYEKIRTRYWWQGMFQDVKHWVRSCIDCQTRKSPRNRHKAPLIPIPVEGPFHRLSVDVLGPFNTSLSGNRFIVIFNDAYTKWAEVFPVKSVEATVIARLLVDEVISRHGAPITLLSDRGTNFMSALVKEVCKLFSIRKLSTTSYHPQTNAITERYNSTLTDSISMYVSSHGRDWDIFLPMLAFAHRVSINDSTGDSPFFLLYGREPKLPADPALIPPSEDLSDSVLEHRSKLVKQIERTRIIAHENIQRAQQKMKAYYDQRAREPQFELGDRVWVFSPKTKKGISKKLLHRWHGPYRIIEKLSPVHYKLRTLTNKPVETTIHANRLKFYFDPNDRPIAPPPHDVPAEPYLQPEDIPEDSFDQTTNEPHDNDRNSSNKIENSDEQTFDSESDPIIDNEIIYNAEKILKQRVRNGKTEYLVKWANYPVSQATWEPPENLLAPELLENFTRGPR